MDQEFHLAEQDRRIAEVVGDDEGDRATARWLAHLKANLILPCEVTGSEDFQWEEPYVLGALSQADYRRLRKTQPSHRDVFVLESVEDEADPDWAMFAEDLGDNARRKTDGRKFLLGLSELRAVEEKTANAQMLDDYSCWLVNNR
jgi:hypothetical protein